MSYQSFKYTGAQQIRQLTARFNRSVKARISYNNYVHWLVRSEKYSIRKVADLLGKPFPTIQSIVEKVDQEQKASKTIVSNNNSKCASYKISE
jgi:hypothetical protein